MTRRLGLATVTAAAAILSTVGTPAAAAVTDRTPPTAPYLLYSSGLRWTGGCLPLTVGIQRSTDNATPRPALVYEVFADGIRLGSLGDPGTGAAVWGTLHFTRAGAQAVTVKAVDAAGNRSAPSNANTVVPYGCPA
jgi:hypothetical protein